MISTIVDGLVVIEAAGKFVEGEELTHFLIENTPGNVDNLKHAFHLYLARFLSGQERYAEAEIEFEKVAGNIKEGSVHYLQCQYNLFMGEHLLANGDRQEARKMFNKALQIHQSNSKIAFSTRARIEDAIQRAAMSD